MEISLHLCLCATYLRLSQSRCLPYCQGQYQCPLSRWRQAICLGPNRLSIRRNHFWSGSFLQLNKRQCQLTTALNHFWRSCRHRYQSAAPSWWPATRTVVPNDSSVTTARKVVKSSSSSSVRLMSVRWLFIMSTSFSEDDGRFVEQNSFGNLLVDDLMRKIEGVLKSLIVEREKALRVGRHSSIRIAIAIINSVKALVSYRFHLLRLPIILTSLWRLVHLLQHFKMDLLGWYTSHIPHWITSLHHTSDHTALQQNTPPLWTSILPHMCQQTRHFLRSNLNSSEYFAAVELHFTYARIMTKRKKSANAWDIWMT